MTNPNAVRSSFTHPSLIGIAGSAVLLFALHGSVASESEPVEQTLSVASADTYEFPDKASLEIATNPLRTEVNVGRTAVRSIPDVYCWDGTNEFTVADAKDKKHKNIGTACLLATKEGWYNQNAEKEVKCLVRLWTRESQFNHKAVNKSSGATGIPQSLPGNKMASAGKDWRTNPKTQIKWGLGYIKGRYDTPCSAWEHYERKGWY